MRPEYQDFCNQLKEERQRLSLSQMEISALLNMNQSHYSKAELGKRVLSYCELQNLCKTEVDTYYVFTGKREQPIEVESFFMESTVKELKRYLAFLCMLDASIYQSKKNTSPYDNDKKVRNIQFALMPAERGKTVFFKLRYGLNYNQTKMADFLRVDIKKLRGLENGKILPDGDLLCQMLDLFKISYALFLNDKNGLICEINYLLDIIKEDKREDVIKTMRTLL